MLFAYYCNKHSGGFKVCVTIPKHEVRIITWKRKIPMHEMTRKQHMADRSEESKRQQVRMRLEKRSVPILGLSESSVLVGLQGKITVYLLQAGISNFSGPSSHVGSS